MENLLLSISIIGNVICLIAVLLHVFGVTLLYKLTSTALKDSQKYLMIYLSFSEIGLCVFFMIYRILIRVLLNHASTSTQHHPPPPSSFQPPPSSFQLPPSPLQHPQRYKYQNIARNWAISPNLGRKI